jgi:Holliday junction resolvase-like predicted endonuclease
MKIEILKALISAVIGAFIYAQFAEKPQSSSNQPQVSQLQQQDCQVIVKKVIKPNGEIDEITQFLASNRQKQEIKPVKTNKNSFDLGLTSNKKAALELNINKWSYEVLTDFNKDHTHIIKYKVLEF